MVEFLNMEYTVLANHFLALVCGIFIHKFYYSYLFLLIPNLINYLIENEKENEEKRYDSKNFYSFFTFLGGFIRTFPVANQIRSLFLSSSKAFFLVSGVLAYVGNGLIYVRDCKAEIKTGDNSYIATDFASSATFNVSEKIQNNLPNVGSKIKFGTAYKKITYISPYVRSNNETSFSSFIDKIRIKIAQFTEKSRHSPVLKALLIGDKSYIAKEQIEKMKVAGIYHVLAISGLHMNILMNFVFFITSRLTRLSVNLQYFLDEYLGHNKLPSILAALAGYTYVLISMESGSALRAFFLNCLCFFIPKSSNKLKALIVSSFILIAIKPTIVFDLGFQLSFLSTFALLSSGSTFNLHLTILPILKQVSVLGFLINPIVLPIFSILLPVIFLSVLFNSSLLISLSDYIIDLVNLIADPSKIFEGFHFPLVFFDFDGIIRIFYTLCISITFLTNNYKYVYSAVFVTVAVNVIKRISESFA